MTGTTDSAGGNAAPEGTAAPATEQVPAATTPEVTTTPDQATEAKAPETTGADPAGEAPPAPKRKGGFQRKIESLEREIEHWRNAALEQHSSERKGVAGDRQPQTAHVQQEPRQENFDNYEAYLVAVAEHRVTQRIADEQRAAEARLEQTRQIEARRAFEARASEASQRYADYDEVAESVLADRSFPISPAMADVVMDSDKGPDLIYWLGNHPEEAARIAALSPLKAARELGRIEDKLVIPTKRTVTQAPPPPTTVKGGEVPSKALAEMSMDEYVAARKAGRAV